MKNLNKEQNYLHLILVMSALAGIIFPLININLHLISTTTLSFGLTSLLQNSNSSMVDLVLRETGFVDIPFYIALPLAAYLLSILLLFSSLILIVLNKFKSILIFLFTTTTTLLIYVGTSLHVLPSTFINDLDDILSTYIGSFGGLFNLIDFSNILEINLGAGYWITLIANTVLLIILVINKIIGRLKNSPSSIET